MPNLASDQEYDRWVNPELYDDPREAEPPETVRSWDLPHEDFWNLPAVLLGAQAHYQDCLEESLKTVPGNAPFWRERIERVRRLIALHNLVYDVHDSSCPSPSIPF